MPARKKLSQVNKINNKNGYKLGKITDVNGEPMGRKRLSKYFCSGTTIAR